MTHLGFKKETERIKRKIAIAIWFDQLSPSVITCFLTCGIARTAPLVTKAIRINIANIMRLEPGLLNAGADFFMVSILFHLDCSNGLAKAHFANMSQMRGSPNVYS